MEEVVVLDVLDPLFVYTFICVEIKTNTERVEARVFQNVQTTLVREAPFFDFYREEGVVEGRRSPDFFLTYSSSLLVLVVPNPISHDRSYWSKSSDLIS
jgi:hypothetical protein